MAYIFKSIAATQFLSNMLFMYFFVKKMLQPFYLPPGSPEGDYNLHHVRVYVRACVRVSRSFL